MTTALTDHRPALWRQRHAEQDRLAMRRVQRRSICGCARCNDGERGEELDVLIRVSLDRINEAGNRICDRSSTW